MAVICNYCNQPIDPRSHTLYCESDQGQAIAKQFEKATIQIENDYLREKIKDLEKQIFDLKNENLRLTKELDNSDNSLEDELEEWRTKYIKLVDKLVTLQRIKKEIRGEIERV